MRNVIFGWIRLENTMFFIGIFGTNSKVVPAGQFSGTNCPVCGKNGTFHICRHYNYLHAFFIPLFRYHNSTCPSCASVFELPPEKGKAAERGETIHVSKEELRVLRNNARLRCPICGAEQSEGSNFCSHCGAKL